jgi:hypothetical protein
MVSGRFYVTRGKCITIVVYSVPIKSTCLSLGPLRDEIEPTPPTRQSLAHAPRLSFPPRAQCTTQKAWLFQLVQIYSALRVASQFRAVARDRDSLEHHRGCRFFFAGVSRRLRARQIGCAGPCRRNGDGSGAKVMPSQPLKGYRSQ